MSYQTPNYSNSVIPRFERAINDIKMFNRIDNAQFNFTRNKDLTSEIERIVYDVAREVVLEARLNYTPVLTGRLRSSITASLPYTKNSNGSVSVDITADVPYAAFQHEFHNTKRHYIEKPFDEMVESGIMEERISRKILQMIGW